MTDRTPMARTLDVFQTARHPDGADWKSSSPGVPPLAAPKARHHRRWLCNSRDIVHTNVNRA
jgi:hypothetical protein